MNRSTKRAQKLKERCETLALVVQQIFPIYRDPAITETQRHFIETIIGAGIWYLPPSDQSWTGMISVEAVRSFHPDYGVSPRLTADHEYPRKFSAAELLGMTWAVDIDAATEIIRLYTEKYSRFNYITPRENGLLRKYQRTHIFVEPTIAYRSAGIRLVQINPGELKSIKKRQQVMIESVLQRAGDEAST